MSHASSQRIIIPMEDEIIHTPESPFCSIDPICPCHDNPDPEALAVIAQQVKDGLLTPDEATATVLGKTL